MTESAHQKAADLRRVDKELIRIEILVHRTGELLTASSNHHESIDQLMRVDQRATEFHTLMTITVDKEQREGILVSIPAARLEYFNKLIHSLIHGMEDREAFDQTYSLLEE